MINNSTFQLYNWKFHMASYVGQISPTASWHGDHSILYALVWEKIHEIAALLVKERFDDNTLQLFRSLQKHNLGFDDASLQNIRMATELSSIANIFQNLSRPNFCSKYNNKLRRIPHFFNSYGGAINPGLREY